MFSIFEKTLPYVIAIYIVLCQNVIINILILTVWIFKQAKNKI